MASKSRPCKFCGTRINFRQMPHGRYVAFEGYDTPHVCDGTMHSPSQGKVISKSGDVEDVPQKNPDPLADLEFESFRIENTADEKTSKSRRDSKFDFQDNYLNKRKQKQSKQPNLSAQEQRIKLLQIASKNDSLAPPKRISPITTTKNNSDSPWPIILILGFLAIVILYFLF